MCTVNFVCSKLHVHCLLCTILMCPTLHVWFLYCVILIWSLLFLGNQSCRLIQQLAFYLREFFHGCNLCNVLQQIAALHSLQHALMHDLLSLSYSFSVPPPSNALHAKNGDPS